MSLYPNVREELELRRAAEAFESSLTPPGFNPLIASEDFLVAGDYWEENGDPQRARSCRKIAEDQGAVLCDGSLWIPATAL